MDGGLAHPEVGAPQAHDVDWAHIGHEILGIGCWPPTGPHAVGGSGDMLAGGYGTAADKVATPLKANLGKACNNGNEA